MNYTFLQSYWWAIISLLAAALVFLMFVQGAQSFLFSFKKEEDKLSIVNVLKNKWELTFTTLVVFGGAFFAAFPLFYAVSFGGAYALWVALLLCFVVQAVSFHYRGKPNNFLGKGTFDTFLWINGVLGVFFTGLIVATFFTGSPFSIDKARIFSESDQSTAFIMHWEGALRGFEAIFNVFNILFALMLLFLCRLSGLLYLVNQIEEQNFAQRCRILLKRNTIIFLVLLVATLYFLFTANGFAVDDNNNHLVYLIKYKYFINFIEQPVILICFLAGAVLLLFALFKTIFKPLFTKGFWFAAIGIIFIVFSLMMILGTNKTAYYPSTYDLQSSLTLANSSSSHFTLKVMTYVSFFIPFVIAYIAYAWKSLTKPDNSEYGEY